MKIYNGELVMKLAARNKEIFSFVQELQPEILDPKKYILKMKEKKKSFP